jgi:DNA invertase Pin-like site-specific DNA recombinase
MIRIHKSGFQKDTPLKGREYVCIYLRVSTSKQDASGMGLKIQRSHSTEYCNRNQYIIYDYYTDVISGTEGSLAERKEYFRMLDDCERNGIKKVIVYDLSRLFRDRESCLLVKKAFSKIGLDIRSVSQQSYSIYDEDDPSAFLLNSLMDAIASYDRLVLVNRLRLARKKKAESGGYAGGGLSTGLSTHRGYLEIIPEELKLVKMIFLLKKKGFSPYAISKLLNGRGIKSKKNGSFYPQTIKRILNNPIYKKGKLKFEGKYYDSELGKLL